MTILDPNRSGLLLSVMWSALAGAPLAGNVLVVDASGSGQFTTIQSAVNAAADGDTILVKAGAYAGFTVDNRRVAVVADTAALVKVTSAVVVRNLGSARDFVVVGLEVGTTGFNAACLRLESNQGSVRVENCHLENLGYTGDAARLRESPDVAFARCTLSTGDPVYPGNALSDGWYAGSRAAIYDSVLRGGDSAGACNDQHACFAPDGGHGVLWWNSSFLFAAGSEFHGGDGGLGSNGGGLDCICGSDGGDGGDGISLSGSTPGGFLLDNRYSHGQGAPTCSGCSSSWDGIDGVDVRGFHTFLDGRARHLAMDNPQRELVSFPIEVTGRPGEEVSLLVSQHTSFRFAPLYRGVQFVQHSNPPFVLGSIPQTGVLTTSLTVPDLGPGVQSKVYYLQTAHRTPPGAWTLSNPVSLVVLDQAF